MSDAGILATFALVHLLAAASPGPNLMVVTRHATTGSRKSGLLAALGVVLAVMTWASAAALGLGALVATYPNAYRVAQYAGAAYLVWLGLSLIAGGISGRRRDGQPDRAGPPSTASIILSGYLST